MCLSMSTRSLKKSDIPRHCTPATTWRLRGASAKNDENDVSPDLLEAGEDVVVEEGVSRPTRVVRNTIDSDGEKAGEPPNVLASADDDCLTLKTP